MRCYLCGEAALGQCRICSQFYCAEHGRVFCMDCADQAVFSRPKPPARPATRGARRAEACYQCGQPAEQACGRCGRYYCPAHADSVGNQATCRRCASRRFWLFVAVVAGLAATAITTIVLTLR
ncbi:MAG: hypothetical protein L0Z62_37340 [Gemmataceae bacterium]|nr:hypothetical protein [Gemmataceae bacterium]